MLDKELKPPYVVPTEKMISENDIKKLELVNKKVLKEIEVQKLSMKISNFFL